MILAVRYVTPSLHLTEVLDTLKMNVALSSKL